MQIDSNSIASITEANQNFSKIARMVDKNGSVVIMKNNTPRYVIIEYSQLEQIEHMPDECVEAVARKVLDRNIEAFNVLAK